MFWFLLAICGAVQFRSEISHYNSEAASYPFVSYVIFYVLVIIMFILNCFADQAPKVSKYQEVQVYMNSLFHKNVLKLNQVQSYAS